MEQMAEAVCASQPGQQHRQYVLERYAPEVLVPKLMGKLERVVEKKETV